MSASQPKDLSQDIQRSFLAHPTLSDQISNLKDFRLFITGGTGFFGCWFLESLSWFYKHLNLDLSVTVLTRDPVAFQKKRPSLAQLPFLKFHLGDIRNFEFPKERFTHMIHGATESGTALGFNQPLVMFETIYQGTQRALEFAQRSGVERFLFTSSGAVYGRQPNEVTHVSEDYLGAPDPLDLRSGYGEGKRVAEYLCASASQKFGFCAPIARCFAFVGPYLPLDGHFAVGNFIRDAISGNSIQISGDGTPFRSYLYGSDLVLWLWGILLKGLSGRAYNVGSESEVSISQLANKVVQTISTGVKVEIARTPIPGHRVERYVPSTQRVREELGLKQVFDLQEGIRRTAQWHSPSL